MFLGDHMKTRIRELREDNDLMQKDIAKVLNMSQRGYSHYENDTNIPNDVLIKLAEFYKTSVDYILYRTDIKKPYPNSIVKED